MIWEAAPTGRRGRQPDYSDAAIQTCLTMKVLFGMALCQTTGFVESLLHLIDLDWSVPNFSTLSHRQKGLKVNIPYRGSQGPLHLLIPSRALLRNTLPGKGWDGSGICLYAKRLEKPSFCRPQIGAVRVQLNHAQLMALLEGLDWKRVRPMTVRTPVFAG